MNSRKRLLAATLIGCAAFVVSSAEGQERRLRAKDIFAIDETILFRDDFASGNLARWNLSEDGRYRLADANPDRIRVVDAPEAAAGKNAVRFAVPRAPNSFRAEISLPHEEGFQERWYGERIFVPEDWVFSDERGNDIVMQWHAIPGNWRATYPNLEISIGNGVWHIRRSNGIAQKPTRTDRRLDEPVEPGNWVSWVVHAKWRPGDDGVLQIWKDGQMVVDDRTPNVYSNIGIEYTPYLKTGIYHPEWNLNTPRKKDAFEVESPVKERVIYVTDFVLGGENATYEEVAPKPLSNGDER